MQKDVLWNWKGCHKHHYLNCRSYQGLKCYIYSKCSIHGEIITDFITVFFNGKWLVISVGQQHKKVVASETHYFIIATWRNRLLGLPKSFSTFSSSWPHKSGDYSSEIRFKCILKPVYDWLSLNCSLIFHWLIAMHFNFVLMEVWIDRCCGSLTLINVMIDMNSKAEITAGFPAHRLSKLHRNKYHLLSHALLIRVSKWMSSSKGATPFF